MHQKWLKDGLEHEKGIESIKSWAMTGQLLELIHNGKVNENKIKNFGDIALGNDKGRSSNKEIIFSMTGGLPMEDTAWAYRVYQKAKENGIGKKLKLWDAPHWA
jgi:ornithine cyclodeaminase